MYTHRMMWKGIELLACRKGWSLPKLAIYAGLDPTALNPSKRVSRDGKPRWPSTETVVKLLAATDTRFIEFCTMIEAETRREAVQEIEILLVDDGLGLCLAAAGTLKRLGHAVRVVAGSTAALDVLDSDQPLGLLCTELCLPDGLEAADRIQKLAHDKRPELDVMHLGTYSHADTPAMKFLLGTPVRHCAAIDALTGIFKRTPGSLPDGVRRPPIRKTRLGAPFLPRHGAAR